MPVAVDNYMTMLSRPRWDVDGGTWYVVQGPPTQGVSKMYRHKPSMNSICESLHGWPVRDKHGCVIGVRYPILRERLRVYREGIELALVFSEREDIFTVATYRRQVTRVGGVPLDVLLFNLACDAHFTQEEWHFLAERMPAKAPIYEACLRRATYPRVGRQSIAA